MKQKLDFAMVFLGLALAYVALFQETGLLQWTMVWVGIQTAVVAGYDFFVKCGIFPDLRQKTKKKSSHITGLALLNDENQVIATWDLYEKTSLIIGIDQGENQVDVNLAQSVYASTLEVEHAVLNYAGKEWYIEDLDSENGTSVVKSQGDKYKLIALKPCLLEKGDIIMVSLVRLKLT